MTSRPRRARCAACAPIWPAKKGGIGMPRGDKLPMSIGVWSWEPIGRIVDKFLWSGSVQKAGRASRRAINDGRTRSRPRLEHEVERGLCRAAKPREAALRHDPAQPLFSGLCAEAEPDLLRARRRCTDHRRGRVVDPSDRVQVVLEAIVRK